LILALWLVSPIRSDPIHTRRIRVHRHQSRSGWRQQVTATSQLLPFLCCQPRFPTESDRRLETRRSLASACASCSMEHIVPILSRGPARDVSPRFASPARRPAACPVHVGRATSTQRSGASKSKGSGGRKKRTWRRFTYSCRRGTSFVLRVGVVVRRERQERGRQGAHASGSRLGRRQASLARR